MKCCRKCQVELVPAQNEGGGNWLRSHQRYYNYICRSCNNDYLYERREKNKQVFNDYHSKYMRKMKQDDAYRAKYNAYFVEYNKRKKLEASE